MSDLYAKEWAEKFDYSQLRKFGSWPSQPASDLLNSQRLRTEGRSTAVDFWQARGARLDGNHNYAKVVRRTGEGKATTTFYVMRSTKVMDTMPADAVVQPRTAALLADLLVLTGNLAMRQ